MLLLFDSMSNVGAFEYCQACARVDDGLLVDSDFEMGEVETVELCENVDKVGERGCG
jgi:hypothetical protein